VIYVRRHNDELAAQLRESRREETRLQDLLKEADVKSNKLSAEISELHRRIGSTTVESDKFSSLPTKGKQSTPAKSVTPRKDISLKRNSSVVEIL